jgi:hypothetical protein
VQPVLRAVGDLHGAVWLEKRRLRTGVGMGSWLARVHFPNGQVRYARYSTVVEELVSDLYDNFCDEGETDDLGHVCYRAEVRGEPSPVDPSKSLSEPNEIIPVRIEVEPDHITWPALYCPRRNEIVGPRSKYFADTLQQTFNLVRRNGRLHLVRADGGDRTLCGEPAAGEIAPFYVCEYPGKPEDPSEPAPRNLYAEWSDGLVCRQCLLMIRR